MTKTISELVVGDSFKNEGELMLMVSAVKPSKSQRGDYYQLTFQDKSGSTNGVMWEIQEGFENFEAEVIENQGIVVSFIGDVTEFKGSKQLTAKKLVVIPDSQIDPTNFVPVVPQDRSEMWKEVRRLIAEVQDVDYKALLVAVFNDPTIRANFVNGIGGIRHHHNYIGGLMEHTLQVTKFALNVVDSKYGFSNLNRDLISTGGLLHDIGKTKEYLFQKSLSMNPNGVEHRYEGVAMLDLVIFQNKLDIDAGKLRKLKNIIMSHHGSYGDASIKIESPEGEVIHHADCISAFVNGYFIKGGN